MNPNYAYDNRHQDPSIMQPTTQRRTRGQQAQYQQSQQLQQSQQPQPQPQPSSLQQSLQSLQQQQQQAFYQQQQYQPPIHHQQQQYQPPSHLLPQQIPPPQQQQQIGYGHQHEQYLPPGSSVGLSAAGGMGMGIHDVGRVGMRSGGGMDIGGGGMNMGIGMGSTGATAGGRGNDTAATTIRHDRKPVPTVHIKTKFPVARIKRIMQADEDVGKVAQVTPVIVSKALELFMVSLVTKAAEEVRLRGAKRVTAAHLKQAVLKEEQFDFLADVIQKIADLPDASVNAGQLSGSGAEGSGGGGGGGGGGDGEGGGEKRTRRARVKKQKTEEEEDDDF